AAEEQGGFYCASGSSTQSYASAAQQEDITGVKSLAVASAAMARRNFARWREQYKPVRGRLFEFFGFWASRAAEEQGGFYCASGSSTQSYASAAQ
ncbi:MAG: hypothetical protein PVJ78_04960, partial [Gammaproteobacteria bacterium]